MKTPLPRRVYVASANLLTPTPASMLAKSIVPAGSALRGSTRPPAAASAATTPRCNCFYLLALALVDVLDYLLGFDLVELTAFFTGVGQQLPAPRRLPVADVETIFC
jgi:hypothetical protein